MPDNTQNFYISGPTHLRGVNWNYTDYRRSIVACLVQGVYVLERDRQEKRQGSHCLASAWWEFFNFQKYCELEDPDDKTIFGAIFKFPAFHGDNYGRDTYVIAFRGTLIKPATVFRDFKLDLMCIFSSKKLELDGRIKIAVDSVEEMKNNGVGAESVCLAGHSLGSTIALLVGKKMARADYRVEAYLFNPPYLSVPIEPTVNQPVKNVLCIANSVVKTSLAAAAIVLNRNPREDDQFFALSNWFPYLFVNETDLICAQYIAHFKQRKIMEKFGAEKIERCSKRELFKHALGRDSEEPLHRIHSAYLITNLSHSPHFREAHGIEQWWNREACCQTELYQFM